MSDQMDSSSSRACPRRRLSGSVYWGYTLFVIATGLIVLGVSYGWPRLTDSPQPRATSIMLALFGLAGLFAAWQDDTAPYLDWLPVLAGLGLLWTFVQNLTRGMGASDAVANVSAQVAGVVIVLSASTWVAAATVPGDKEAIVVGLVAIIAAQCMTRCRGRRSTPPRSRSRCRRRSPASCP